MTEPYPLHWPEHWPRTPAYRRRRSSFKTAMGKARDDMLRELQRLGAGRVVVSTDMPVRIDGLFYANAAQPNDPGVAVYFHWRGKPYVVACDTYQRVYENVRAVGKTIEAMRTIERHGATQLLERAVSGFSALPPGAEDGAPIEPAAPWWETLGVGQIDGMDPVQIAGDPKHPMRKPMLNLAESVYRIKVGDAHPDKPGGSTELTRDLNLAIEAARRALE